MPAQIEIPEITWLAGDMPVIYKIRHFLGSE
jgi:hypothetical protein